MFLQLTGMSTKRQATFTYTVSNVGEVLCSPYEGPVNWVKG